MRLSSRLGKRNKNTDHYQRNYEEVTIPEDSVTVGMKSGQLVRGKHDEKEMYYRDLKERITTKEKHDITVIAKSSGTIYEVFSKMESEKLPLDYLVSLGIVEELDIESYQNIKTKGLDVADTLTNKEIEGIDGTLKMQVLSQTSKMPELVDELSDRELGEQEKENEKYVDDYQRQVNEGTDEEEQEESKERESEEKKVDVREEAEEKEDEKDSGEDDEYRGELEDFKNLAQKVKEKNKKEDKKKKKDEQALEKKRIKGIRDVYLIGEGSILPQIEGYNIREVENMSDITEYTSSRRNLLIVTQDIPKKIHKGLIEWLRGLEKSKRRYRIVTLDDSSVTHNLIEDKVTLTKESLDGYYQEYNNDLYEEEDVEGFLNISNLIK